ncbi:phage tail protein [Marilutibacter spongiae]|uniref:Tip attachment protein J domain-containing protein n=1 Tax=Marilutibacter spongiae TaxID=2025720 RepID=A0A7W3Y7A4_9GAMM|nr:phage tail protein [Lysobacter spongiae]MBB1061875.1 hypothetical protein [Lysobacter spongiae]
MGSSKKQTVGYWYHPAIHMVLGKGPIDAVLKIRGGDVDAWSGEVTSNATITIDNPNLWGGEEAEGGIQGDVDLMFGAADQLPNPAISSLIGPDSSAHRGHAALLFKGGRYGAMNPYPKPLSVMVRRILKGWDGDVCWYPETAEIFVEQGGLLALSPESGGWRYTQVTLENTDDYSAPGYDDSSWAVGAAPFASEPGHPYAASAGFPATQGTEWTLNSQIWVRRTFDLPTVFDFGLTVFVDNLASVWINGVKLLDNAGTTSTPSGPAFTHDIAVPASILVEGQNHFAMVCRDVGTYSYAATKLMSEDPGLIGINPAHLIYYSLTAANMQGEPVELINDASFRAAADQLYAEGFCLCTEWDPDQETVEQFRQRICNVIAANCTRSTVDGQWYLDLVRGEYVLEDLPVLTDDDILDFEAEPTLLDDAVNQVAVKWFDPLTKQARTTAPLHALGAVEASGINAETIDYSAIPVEPLALRVAERDLRSRSTPLWRYTLTTNRRPYNWRLGTYFRLQAPKRGIADSVCLVGDIGKGTLRSGAISLVATQDVFAMPTTTYVTGEPPVPPATGEPAPAPAQAAFEAPYVELAGSLPAADLQALDAEAGYVLVVGARPAVGLNYQLNTRLTGGEYEAASLFDWCPSAVVEEGDDLTGPATAFTLTDGSLLDRVALGEAALWGNEIVRVDALDVGTGAAVLGRGCGDTVRQAHAPGERIWFFDAWAGSDLVEYVTGEEVQAKLLTRTGNAILDLATAPESSVTLDQRAYRPYPPAGFTVQGESYPGAAFGEISLSAVHRDRVQQADQLVDDTEGTIGPEAGTTYNARFYADGVLEHTVSGATAFPITYTPAGNCLLTIELEAERDGVASWQAHTHTLSYTVAEPTQRLTEAGDVRVTESDDRRITE